MIVATTFFVAGVPIPQGSKKGYRRGPGVQIVDDNKKTLLPWRAEVARVAEATWAYGAPIDGPVRVAVAFVLPRPKSVKRDRPHVAPDIDKLLRALFDGITDAGVVWADDSRVVEVEATKHYGDVPGVHVVISRIETVAVSVKGGPRLAGERES